MIRTYWLLAVVLLFGACNPSTSQTTKAATQIRPADPAPNYSVATTPTLEEAQLDAQFKGASKAYFASGCFWCTEEVYQRVKGVLAVYAGYTGATTGRPTYELIGSGRTGYAESVVVYYDPTVVSYDLLLEFFYASHDPTQLNRQGPDVGTQYRSAVFYLNDEQEAKAKAYQEKLAASGKYDAPIATEISPASTFYLAEEYHQDYYPNHPENPYVQRVSKPKVEKFAHAYAKYLVE